MDVTDDTPIGEVIEYAQQLVEKAYPAISIIDTLADAAKSGAFIILQHGGVDAFDFETWWNRQDEHDREFPLNEDDVEDFRLAEAILLIELAMCRKGMASKGIDVPRAPLELRLHVGGN